MEQATDQPEPLDLALAAPERRRLGPVTLILACAIALTILGLTILFSATASFKQGPTFYLTKQLIGVGGALLLGLIASRIDLESLRRHAPLIALAALALLLLVLVPHIGITVNGSRRWLGLGAVRLQVSEIGKLAVIFCLAHYLAINQTRLAEFRRGFLYPFLIMLAAAGLVAREPDLGTAALITALGLLLLFVAGTRWRYMLPTIGAVIGAFALLVWLMPNRLARFTAFLDVEGNKQSGTYQLYQALVAFAAGGVDGVGLGQGRQQLNRMPEAQTDFILPVIGEELGLYGTIAVVLLFTTIFIAGLIHLRRAPNMFQFLLAAGCILIITLQAIANLGVVTGILPTKGVPLPFISAGLSNLLLMGTLIGILVNTQRTWPRPPLSRNKRIMREIVQP